MKLVDLNILLYVVNQDSAQHAVIRNWWESALAGEERIGLTWGVILGFLRLVTNPRVFPQPLSTEQALAKVDQWLAQPVVGVVGESPEHWRTLRGLLEASGTAGNLTTDAHLASLAMTHGASLVSCDADFGRFPKLQWENPMAPK